MFFDHAGEKRAIGAGAPTFVTGVGAKPLDAAAVQAEEAILLAIIRRGHTRLALADGLRTGVQDRVGERAVRVHTVGVARRPTECKGRGEEHHDEGSVSHEADCGAGRWWVSIAHFVAGAALTASSRERYNPKAAWSSGTMGASLPLPVDRRILPNRNLR